MSGILSGFPTRYVLAALLVIAGLALISCGASVCWLRWRRCCRGKSVDEIRREQGRPPDA